MTHAILNALELVAVLIPLSRVYDDLDEMKSAHELAERAIKITELTPLHTKGLVDQGFTPERVSALSKDLKVCALARLGELLTNEDRDTEAEPILKRVLSILGRR